MKKAQDSELFEQLAQTAEQEGNGFLAAKYPHLARNSFARAEALRTQARMCAKTEQSVGHEELSQDAVERLLAERDRYRTALEKISRILEAAL